MAASAERPAAVGVLGGTFYLIFIQVASRALTFIGNQILLRFLTPDLLGISVQLELLSVTILYFARESLRVSFQRQPANVETEKSETKASSSTQNRIQAVVNLAYLAITLGMGLSLIFGYMYFTKAPMEALQSPLFEVSFQCYALATLLELLAEPGFLIIQQQALYSTRARAETSGAIGRCIAACVTAVIMQRLNMPPSTLPFAVGQLTYGLVLFLTYLVKATSLARSQKFSLVPKTIKSSSNDTIFRLGLFRNDILSLATTMYFQSIFKLLLTQGDALIMSILSSLSDQGAFALASNYGGLLARLVFQPIEESSRNTFGRLLSTSSKDSESQSSNVRRALSNLSTILRFYCLLALPLVTIATELLPLIVLQVIGTKWSTPATTALLSTFCYYIPFMAINGILDAFVTSVASPAELRMQSVWMALFTGVYGVVAWILLDKLQLGAQGLVIANIINMTLRIIWSINAIQHWIVNNTEDGGRATRGFWSGSVPHLSTIGIAACVALGLKSSDLIYASDHSQGKELDLQRLGLVVAGGAVLGATM